MQLLSVDLWHCQNICTTITGECMEQFQKDLSEPREKLSVCCHLQKQEFLRSFQNDRQMTKNSAPSWIICNDTQLMIAHRWHEDDAVEGRRRWNGCIQRCSFPGSIHSTKCFVSCKYKPTHLESLKGPDITHCWS